MHVKIIFSLYFTNVHAYAMHNALKLENKEYELLKEKTFGIMSSDKHRMPLFKTNCGPYLYRLAFFARLFNRLQYNNNFANAWLQQEA